MGKQAATFREGRAGTGDIIMKNRNLDNHDDWATPMEVYNKLNEEFHFDFDPCPLNPNFDGLKRAWGESNFVNPPYSRKLKEAFIHAAITHYTLFQRKSVLLIPVSTSTRIFHNVLMRAASEIRFVYGRIPFLGVNAKGEYVNKKCGMHDSMIVVLRPGKDPNTEPIISTWTWKGDES